MSNPCRNPPVAISFSLILSECSARLTALNGGDVLEGCHRSYYRSVRIPNGSGAQLMKPAQRTVTSPAWFPWIPALLWFGIIALESTDLLSATHTLSLVHRVLALFQLHIEPQVQANAVLRKFGHFVGYAVLSWLLFQAWRATLPRPAAV